MAYWGLKYQCCFKAKDDQEYSVYIYKKDYQNDRLVYQLTAAANPFITQEADSDDPFTPVRGQTGYLRILYQTPVNASGTMTIEEIIEDLVPENNTDIFVRLIKGQYRGSASGSWFLPDSEEPIQWQGFIKAQVFSQRWSGSMKEVEIPVASILETMKSVSISTMPAISLPLYRIIYEAADAILPSSRSFTSSSRVTNETLVWTDVLYSHEMMNFYPNGDNIWSKVYINRSAFLKSKEFTTEGNVKNQYIEGMNFYEILSGIAKLFGLSVREDGQHLHIHQNSYTSTSIPAFKLTWRYFETGSDNYITWGGLISPKDIAALDFRTTDNQRSITLGRKNAWATLQLNANFQLGISFPTAPENEDEVFSILDGAYVPSNKLRVQPHKGLNSLAATYAYTWYLVMPPGATAPKWNPTVNQLGETTTQVYIGSTNPTVFLIDTQTTYTANVNDAVIYNNKDFVWNGTKWTDYYQYPYEYWQQVFLSTPLNNDDNINPLGMALFPMWQTAGPVYSRTPLRQYMTVGAIPVRFSLDAMGEQKILQQGHLLTVLPDMYNGDPYPPRTHYKLITIATEQNYLFSDGYIVINFNALLINTHHFANPVSNPNPYKDWVEFINSKVDGAQAQFKVQLRWGSEYWNGSQWVSSEADFTITTDPHSINSNYTSTMNCDDVGGYYIPVPQNVRGNVEFTILSYFRYGSEDVHCLILTDMNVQYIPTRSTVISTSETNRYMRTILAQGFSEDVEVGLSVGTWNNNIPSVNLLLDSNSAYIQQLVYRPAQGTEEEEDYQAPVLYRPEIRLLEYLQMYYMQKRHIYKATVHKNIEGDVVNFYKDLFQYEGRLFCAVLSSRDWKRDTIRAKFIESFVKSEE